MNRSELFAYRQVLSRDQLLSLRSPLLLLIAAALRLVVPLAREMRQRR